MKPTEFKDWFEAMRAEIDRNNRARKNSMNAIFELFDLYRSLDDGDRLMADDVIADWVVSADESLRYDAMALIRKFRIRHTVMALGQLVHALASQESPSAPHERAKARQLLEELQEHDQEE